MFEKCQGAWRPRSRASHGHIYSVAGIIIRSCVQISPGLTCTHLPPPPGQLLSHPHHGVQRSDYHKGVISTLTVSLCPPVWQRWCQDRPSARCVLGPGAGSPLHRVHPAPPPPPRPPGHGDGDAGMTEDSSYNGEIINYYILQIYDDLGLRIVDS